ncbi:EPIDERMAL PATTERNING FACTOR-like protein 6 [Impatiens glandulifera]|uniref:EPIDERMAL PATTERNING FACTOR-like protein 6 n=1 Tax=Impatiens glandulifera TaxID=253017 RepID=UPI001FB0DAB6|nr:EPIDERMAL PATTERNING FACTOR-like protein 6 [Impatiens glandulifera]
MMMMMKIKQQHSLYCFLLIIVVLDAGAGAATSVVDVSSSSLCFLDADVISIGNCPLNTRISRFYYQEYEVTVDNAIMEKAITTSSSSSMENLNEFEPHFNGEDDDQSYHTTTSTSTLRRRRRRFLTGLGSSPPRCRTKCGKCTPCTPVHVPLPPGKPVTAEYYPEAWRCKCGNRLFLP